MENSRKRRWTFNLSRFAPFGQAPTASSSSRADRVSLAASADSDDFMPTCYVQKEDRYDGDDLSGLENRGTKRKNSFFSSIFDFIKPKRSRQAVDPGSSSNSSVQPECSRTAGLEKSPGLHQDGMQAFKRKLDEKDSDSESCVEMPCSKRPRKDLSATYDELRCLTSYTQHKRRGSHDSLASLFEF